jgi:hypothetical protein
LRTPNTRNIEHLEMPTLMKTQALLRVDRKQSGKKEEKEFPSVAEIPIVALPYRRHKTALFRPTVLGQSWS